MIRRFESRWAHQHQVIAVALLISWQVAAPSRAGKHQRGHQLVADGPRPRNVHVERACGGRRIPRRPGRPGDVHYRRTCYTAGRAGRQRRQRRERSEAEPHGLGARDLLGHDDPVRVPPATTSCGVEGRSCRQVREGRSRSAEARAESTPYGHGRAPPILSPIRRSCSGSWHRGRRLEHRGIVRHGQWRRGAVGTGGRRGVGRVRHEHEEPSKRLGH